MKIKVGAMVRLKHASIRGPSGELKRLDEAADYGIVTEQEDASGLEFSTVQWFDYMGGARIGRTATTMVRTEELEDIVLND